MGLFVITIILLLTQSASAQTWETVSDVYGNFTSIELASALTQHNSSEWRFYINMTDLSEGVYTYYGWANDTAGNSNQTETRTLTIDATPPTVEYAGGTEANNTAFARNWIYVNVSVIESNEENITFYLFNASLDNINSSTFGAGNRSVNFTNLDEGSYYYNVTVRDKISTEGSTETRKITLDNTLPLLSQIECEINSTNNWGDCSDALWNSTILRVRANCTDAGNDLTNATFKLENIPDSNVIFDVGNATSIEGAWWIYNNTDLTIQDSGGWNLTVSCIDSYEVSNISHVNWTVPWGELNVSLITTNKNVTENQFFTFQSKVECVGGECGDVTATLDPHKIESTILQADEIKLIKNPVIGFSNSPTIFNASVEPIKVQPGDVMKVRAEIIDYYGIVSVKADMGGIETINLELKEGNVYQGVWEKKWLVHDTEVRDYNTTISTVNVLGYSSSVNVEWSDPVYTPKTCGSDCGAGLAYGAGGTCTMYELAGTCSPSSISCDGTDTVVDIRLNATSVLPGDVINVIATVNCYNTDDDVAIYYYNGTSWSQEAIWDNSCPYDGAQGNVSVNITADNVLGTHYVRAMVSYYEIVDSCFDGIGEDTEYCDQDDINFTVEEGKYPPTINTLTTSPSTVGINSNITCEANITDPNDDTIIWANFTVKDSSDNIIIDNVNGTHSGDIWTSAYFVANSSGTWNCSVTTSDDNSNTNSSITFAPGIKGVVSTAPGAEPFWTSSSNPLDFNDLACLENMKAGDSCNQAWLVNASGPLGTWEFYVFANATNYSSYVSGNESNKINITVTLDSTNPILNFTSPTEDNNSFISTNHTRVNMSITEPNLDSFKFSWNNTNYSFYDDSLVFAMNFNNNSGIGEYYNNSNGSKIVDISKYGNNGTLYVGADGSGNYTSGRFGGAYNFDGTDDYVDCGNDSSLNIINSITIEAWVKVCGGSTDYPRIVSKKYEGPYELLVNYNLNANIQLALYNSTGSGHWCDGVTNISDNKWHHVAGTWNGSIIHVYVDGELDDLSTQTLHGNLSVNSSSVRVGAQADTSWDYLNGTIDEVRIHNRSLSADEILFHYQSEFQKYNSTGWRFINNITNLSDGTYTYYGWANDTAGNSNLSDIRTLTVDTVSPTISNEAVNDSGIYVNESVKLNATVTDNEKIGTVKFYIETPHGSYNVTADNLSTEYLVFCNSTGGTDGYCFTNETGQYNWTSVWANDSTGNVNSTSPNLNFIVSEATGDMTAPALNYTSPTPDNNSYVSTNHTLINMSISESNLDTFRFSWNNTNYIVYDDSLVLAMNFNNNSGIGEYYNNSNGTKIVDISKYGNNGTLYVGADDNGSYTTGRFGGAYEFDGLDDYVDCGNDSSLNITDAITIEAWIYWKGKTSKGQIANKHDWDNKQGYILACSGDDKIEFQLGNGSSFVGLWSPVIGKNKWLYVVAKWNGTKMKIFLDGEEIGWDEPFSGPIVNADEILAIGKSSAWVGEYFNGTIDEVRIYNRSLTADEIWFHYQSEFQKYNSSEWRFINNITNLSDGTYTYYGWANDTAGNSNSSEIRTLTVNTGVPTVAGVVVNDDDGGTIQLTVTERVINCNATLFDVNGYEDIVGANATLYYNLTSNASAGDDKNLHYTNSSCSLTGGDGTNVTAVCAFTLEHEALNGTWVCEITAWDTANNTGSGSGNNSVDQLIALSILEDGISFGNMALGENSSAANSTNITNQGNVQIDIRVHGNADMSCALGSLGIGNISFNHTNGSYDSMSSNKLNTSPQNENAFNLGVEGEDTGEDIPSTKNEYWTINIPETGVKGNCNNTITVTAVVG